MDKELKNAICMAYEAPAPSRKKEFLQHIAYETIHAERSRLDMIRLQIGYIHKGTWSCAIAVFLFVLFFLSNQDENTIFLAGALTPFLALSVLFESSRSHRYNMEELEAATKYSLRSVVFSRLLILGVFDSFLLLLIITITGLHSGLDLLQTSAYILLPYLLTMWLGLIIEMSETGRYIPYTSAAVSMMVSISIFISKGCNLMIIQPDYGFWWEIITVIMIILLAGQGGRKYVQMEEPRWN